MDEKPPGNMDIRAGDIPAFDFVVRRFKGMWGLWVNDWDIPSVRGALFNRRILILKDIW